MNHAADNTSLQVSDAKDLAWDAVEGSEDKMARICAELARKYPALLSPGDVLRALYQGVIGPAEIDTQVRELIAREASKLRRTP